MYVGLLVIFLVLFYLVIGETKGLTVEEAAVVYESQQNREAALARERELRASALTPTVLRVDEKDTQSTHAIKYKV